MAIPIRKRRSSKQPWFGTRAQTLDLISAADRWLVKVPQSETVEVYVELKGSRSSQVLPLSLTADKLRTSVKALRARCRGLDASGGTIAEVVLEWDRNGVVVFATSSYSDWVDLVVLDTAGLIRDSQSRWLLGRSWLLRAATCTMGAIDAMGLGLLSAVSLGKIGGAEPDFALGAIAAALLLMAFTAAGSTLPLFAITRENSQGLYLSFVKLLASVLCFGVGLQVLINLAT